jgi:hypothetical protein
MLFENFFVPGIPAVVVVREKQRQRDDDDMRPIEHTHLPSGVKYDSPCRNLAFSDIAVARVSLGPNCSTPWNWHSGCEILFPIRGLARVDYRKGPICKISAVEEHAPILA